MRTAKNRPFTALEMAIFNSGHDLRWYAKRLAEPGSTERQLKNAEAVLRRHLRHGNASWNYARRVATLAGFQDTPLHDVLLKPRISWPAWATGGQGSAPPRGATPQGAAGTPGKAVSKSPGGGDCGPASHHSPHSNPRRNRPRVVLEVL